MFSQMREVNVTMASLLSQSHQLGQHSKTVPNIGQNPNPNTTDSSEIGISDMDRLFNLMDEALDIGDLTNRPSSSSIPAGRIVLVEDCIETSGAFVLHHLLKRFLSAPQSSSFVIFVAFAQSFSHYDRILRKMGCNLVVQRDNKRLLFFDMLALECPDGDGVQTIEGGLLALYGKIQKAVEVCSVADPNRAICIMIDDISLMEVAARGSSKIVIDFLHYCHTLTTQLGCTLVTLNHDDVYSSDEGTTFLTQMGYLADIVVKIEPLATGLAADVHGQVTVSNKGTSDGLGSSRSRFRNFHFRIKENSVDYFYPGSRT